jgi:3'-phosphoadenosine 5'-phosphosulfate sulfotransferase (PAPS reductase)/FAD synthetase
MRVLSLGAGVQSSTLLLMACEGEEQIDAAVFADTGWEPAAVYKHLDWLESQAQAAGIPLHRVSEGDIRSDALDASHGRFASMPLYQQNADGTRGMARRQCTSEYKLKPIRRQVKVLGATPGTRGPGHRYQSG